MKIAMGEEFSNAWAFSLALAPAALGAATIEEQEQSFSIPAGTLPTGVTLAVTDVVFVTPPSQSTSLCPTVGAHINASGQVVLHYANLTAAANTPVTGTYLFFVVRP